MEDTRGTFDLVSEPMARQAGFFGAVALSRELSDRLEVPEEWQEVHSWDARVWETLVAARNAMKGAPAGQDPVPFLLAVPDSQTGRTEIIRLGLSFDGRTMLIDFLEGEN